MSKSKLTKNIEDMAGAITDPIIAHTGGWGDTIPEWLRDAIRIERLAALKEKEPTGTDAEALAYLYTLGLTQPLDSDAAEIFYYLTTKVMRRWQKDREVPADLVKESLSDYLMGELRRLKNWIYDRRIKYRKERKTPA